MSYSKTNEQEEAELALLSNEDSLSTTGSDDLEANQKDENTTATTLEPEYQTPTTMKFVWLGAYFLFSMLLTMYNKLILGSVSMVLRTCLSRLTMVSTVQIPLAPNVSTYQLRLGRHLRIVEAWILQIVQIGP